MEQAHGYYEPPIVNDKYINFENFDNSQCKYWKEENYISKQRFIRKNRDKWPSYQFI